MHFNHVGISVSDIDRSIAFYKEFLGLEKLCEVFPFGDDQFSAVMGLPNVAGRMCMIGKGSLRLELFEFSRPVPAPKDANYPVSDHGISHFGVTVDNVAETYARLEAAGVRMHAPVITFPGGMMATYCRDPDGNVFEIMEQGAPPQG